jgi:putative endonuclease
MPRKFCFFVYILTSSSRRVLYTGLTNNLHKRVFEHKNHLIEGFTDVYNATRLVYFESFDDIRNAIDREKQIKRWRREKKVALIRKFNPSWRDLAEGWYETQGPWTRAPSSRAADSVVLPRDDTRVGATDSRAEPRSSMAAKNSL